MGLNEKLDRLLQDAGLTVSRIWMERPERGWAWRELLDLTSLLGSAVAAWRLGTGTVVPTVPLGWILSSLSFDVVLRGPETDRVPSAYFISFFFYVWPFLRLGRAMRKEAVDETLSLRPAIPIALIAGVNSLIAGILALATRCNVGVSYSGCAELLAALRDWDQ